MRRVADNDDDDDDNDDRHLLQGLPGDRDWAGRRNLAVSGVVACVVLPFGSYTGKSIIVIILFATINFVVFAVIQ